MITMWENYTQQNPETYEPVALPILEGGVTEVIYCPFCRDIIVQVTIGGLSSGESVAGRVEGNLDGGDNFGNLAADDNDTEITTNGVTLLKYSGALPPYIRASGFTTTNENSVATITLQLHIPNMAQGPA